MEEGIDTNLDVDCTKAIPRSIVIYFDMKFGMGAYIKILGIATQAISRSIII